MSDESKPVVVRILDKEYRIACRPGEEDALNASARFLSQKMRDIKSNGKVIGTDRIAVMAALNIAHELLQKDREDDDIGETVSRRVKHLRDKIEIALNQSNQLEL